MKQFYQKIVKNKNYYVTYIFYVVKVSIIVFILKICYQANLSFTNT